MTEYIAYDIAIDPEWVMAEPTPIKFLAYRAIKVFYEDNGSILDDFYSNEKMFEFFDIDDAILETFLEMEYNFQLFVFGEKLEDRDRQMYVKPIRKLNQLTTEGSLMASIYWDNGEGFLAENRLDFSIDTKANSLIVNIDNCNNSKILRFDPMQWGGIIQIKNIRLILSDGKHRDVDINKLKSNGIIDKNNRMIKVGQDPQIYLDLRNYKNIISVRFNFSIEFVDYHDDILLQEIYKNVKGALSKRYRIKAFLNWLKGKL